MIDMHNNTAGTKNARIKEWKVVFHVPQLGIFLTLGAAVEAAKTLELNPVFVVVPMAAAITEADEMEIWYR